MLLAVFAQSAPHDVVQVQVDASGSASPGSASPSDECMDTNDSCRTWAADGECSSNPGFMLSACRESCFQCESAACSNDAAGCEAWAAAGECAANEKFMVSACRHACRICFVNQTAACRRPDDAFAAAAPGTLPANVERLARGAAAPRVLSREPWVLAFDDFLSASEVRVRGRVSPEP